MSDGPFQARPMLPAIEAAFIRVARKEHHCAGQHITGIGTVRCGRGPIFKGSTYVEYCGETASYQSGRRYHMDCAVTQGLVREEEAP